MKLCKGLSTLRRLGPVLALSLVVACATDTRHGTESTAAVVAEAQSMLADLGYEPGPADGIVGPRTATAAYAYQSDHGLPTDGKVNRNLIDHLAAIRQTRLAIQAQRHLAKLGYNPGPIDGREGAATRAAVAAFQRTAGLPRDGRVTARLVAALATASARARMRAERRRSTAAKAADVAALGPAAQVLTPGDRVVLRTLGTGAKAAELQVRVDGRLALPKAGSVQAAGLDLKELRDRITVALIERYMDQLEVTVERGDTAAAALPDPGTETLAPGDRILVSAAGAWRTPAELLVARDGWLAVPGVGRVRAAGLGAPALEGEIAAKLLESYMSKLDVSVDLVSAGGTARTKN